MWLQVCLINSSVLFHMNMIWHNLEALFYHKLSLILYPYYNYDKTYKKAQLTQREARDSLGI